MYFKCRNKGTKKPEQSYSETEPEIRLWNDDKGDNFQQNLNMLKINEILSNFSDMTAQKSSPKGNDAHLRTSILNSSQVSKRFFFNLSRAANSAVHDWTKF